MAALALSLLLIPDWRLPSARWRPLVWTILASTALAAVARMLIPGPIESFREVISPFGVEGAKDLLEVLYAVGFGLALGAALLAAVSLGLRRRRANQEERAQIRWVVLGGVLVTVTFVIYGVVYGISNTGRAVDLLESCS